MHDEFDTRLLTVFRKVFRQPQIEINDLTSPDQIQGWDSLNHLWLIHAIEQEFSVKFAMREIIALKSVGKLREAIHSKLS